jgi:transcriptional regulator with XRE-family HTH domain
MTGRELYKWRIANEMTQQALADALHVHRVTIAKYEAGMQTIPHWLHLALIGLQSKRKK